MFTFLTDFEDEIFWMLSMTQIKMTMDRVVCLGRGRANKVTYQYTMQTFWQKKYSLKLTVKIYNFLENVNLISYLFAHLQQSNTQSYCFALFKNRLLVLIDSFSTINSYQLFLFLNWNLKFSSILLISISLAHLGLIQHVNKYSMSKEDSVR